MVTLQILCLHERAVTLVRQALGEDLRILTASKNRMVHQKPPRQLSMPVISERHGAVISSVSS